MQSWIALWEKLAPRMQSVREITVAGPIHALSEEFQVSPLKFSLKASLAVLFLLLPALVLVNLDRAVDFSDTGFYYLSIAELPEISMQTTQFAVAWNLLPVPDNMYWQRLATFAGLLLAGSFLFGAVWGLLPAQQDSSLITKITVAAAGAGSAATYYHLWLPDPSYNSLTYMLTMTLGALACQVIRKLSCDRLPKVEIVISAFLLSALAITKPPAALIAAVVIPACILMTVRPRLPELGQIVLFSGVGAMLFVSTTSVLVEPVTETFLRLQGGLERRKILARDVFSRPGQIATEDLWRIVQGHWFFLGLIAAGYSGQLFPRLFARSRKLKAVVMTLGLAGWIGLAFNFYQNSDGFYGSRLTARGDYLGALLLASLIMGLASLLMLWRRKKPVLPARVFVVALMIAGLQAGLFLGTTNNWFVHMSLMCSFSFLVLLLLCHQAGKLITFLPVVIGILTMQWASYQRMSLHPYRVPAALAQQDERVLIRQGKSALRVDAETRQTLEDLSEADAIISSLAPRPVLIDLTGRLPFVAYHLNMRPMISPWPLSGYPGSQEFFDTAASRLDPASLENAWILDAPDYPQRFATSSLSRNGLKMDDYVEVVRTRSASLNADIILLAPNSRAGN